MKHKIQLINTYFIVLLLLTGRVATGQDVQFSQYYNLIQYQNPAFVGTSYSWRGILHSRIQWPGLDASYITNVAAIDHNLAAYNSGIGVMFMSDKQGSVLRSYKAIAQYSYQADLSPRAVLRAGLNAGYVRRELNNTTLYYPEQFNGSGFSNGNNVPQYTRNLLDMSAGALFYTPKFWLGLSAAHINRPNQSLIGGVERYPIKYDLLTGYKFTLWTDQNMRYLSSTDEDVWTLYPTVLYKWQGKSDQLDIGLYTIYRIIKLGFWYRGVPIKNYGEEINNESIIALVGLKFRNISVNYSYDFGVSSLAPYSRGSHEINLTFLYPPLKNNKRQAKTLPCPEFYGF